MRDIGHKRYHAKGLCYIERRVSWRRAGN